MTHTLPSTNTMVDGVPSSAAAEGENGLPGPTDLTGSTAAVQLIALIDTAVTDDASGVVLDADAAVAAERAVDAGSGVLLDAGDVPAVDGAGAGGEDSAGAAGGGESTVEATIASMSSRRSEVSGPAVI